MLPMILGMFLMMPPGPGAAPDRSFRVLVNHCRAASQLLDLPSWERATASHASLAVEAAYCWGYLLGAADAINNSDFTRGLLCVPDNVTAEELGKVIVKVADQHPDLLHEHMVFGLSFALGFTYPCAKEKAD